VPPVPGAGTERIDDGSMTCVCPRTRATVNFQDLDVATVLVPLSSRNRNPNSPTFDGTFHPRQSLPEVAEA